jgi:CheY-like chemotaxis protein
VAKILVADDNSNIQKMVGLALKDQGIDVVAVGNGEAAVRKISDVRPDLVLADVFMPVRNGYEVCKYVKDDTSLAHIPVILLVGAFDPLDEQEAQRVGADGVLKKPFVPPDPLVSMVKSALSRAGVLTSQKAAESAPMQAVDMIAPRVREVPVVASVPAFEEASEETVQSVPRLPEPVRIDSGAPVAFGSLLETPAKEAEEDLSYLSSTNPGLAPERDWGSSDEAEEAGEEESLGSWRRDGEAFDDDRTAGAAHDWRDTSAADLPARRTSRESWAPVHEKASTVEATEDRVGIVTKESLPTAVPTNKPTTPPLDGKPWASPADARDEEEKTVPPVVAADGEPATVRAYSGENTAAVENAKNEVAREIVAAASDEKPAGAQPEPVKSSMAESWFSPAPSPWDAEIKRASELTAGWDGPGRTAPPITTVPEVSGPHEASPTTVGDSAEVAAHEAGLTSAAVEAIREEAALVTENVPVDSSKAAEPSAALQANMDDLVAKVLAKMSPDVLQAVTREILKPVVEAMVRDELNPKKS